MLTPSLAVCWGIPLDSQTLPIFQHCTQQTNSIPSLPKVSSSPGHGPAQHRNPIQQTALEGTGWHEGNISDTFPAFLSIREARSQRKKQTTTYVLASALTSESAPRVQPTVSLQGTALDGGRLGLYLCTCTPQTGLPAAMGAAAGFSGAGREERADDNADQQPSSAPPEHFRWQGPVWTASGMARCSVMVAAWDLKSQFFTLLG